MNDQTNTLEGQQVNGTPLLPSPPSFELEKTFVLSRPVKAVVGTATAEIDKITLRAPLAADVFAIGGLATRTNWMPGGLVLEMDTDRLQKYLVRLSGQDASVIGSLPARDIKFMYQWLNEELSQVGN
jgi:hypothetical protein